MAWDVLQPSRLFVDHIWKRCSKYPVWDPQSDSLEVGDYGVVDQDTGTFMCRGNIFGDQAFKGLVEEWKPRETGAGDGVLNITSFNAKSLTVDPSLTLDARVVMVKYECAFSFVQGSGALLAAHKPRDNALPRLFPIDVLTKHEKLRGMDLVTKVTTCEAYALYLAGKENSWISLALTAQAPGVPVSPSASLKWESKCGGGLYRAEADGEQPFTVLYSLKKCKEKEKKKWWQFRDGVETKLEGLDLLEDSTLPWGTLDDDGVEEPFHEDEF